MNLEKAVHLHRFILCLTMHLIYLFLNVYEGSSLSSFKLSNFLQPNEDKVKTVFQFTCCDNFYPFTISSVIKNCT